MFHAHGVGRFLLFGLAVDTFGNLHAVNGYGQHAKCGVDGNRAPDSHGDAVVLERENLSEAAHVNPCLACHFCIGILVLSL